METITLPLYYTHHGPIIRVDKERHRAYSVKVPNYDGVNYSTGLYLLMKARNLDQFKGALARQLMPRWNLLYSDAVNIWVHNGNVAPRAEDVDWSKPVPGWTKETEWGPYIPFERYPQLLNPPSGFLQNCNNPPWVATWNSGLKPLEPAPYYLQVTPKADAGEEVLNTRGERLFRMSGEDRKFTLEEMIELGFDTYVLPADVIVPLLVNAAAKREPLNDASLAQMACLRAWDRHSSKASVAYTYLYYIIGPRPTRTFSLRRSFRVSFPTNGRASIYNRSANKTWPGVRSKKPSRGLRSAWGNRKCPGAKSTLSFAAAFFPWTARIRSEFCIRMRVQSRKMAGFSAMTGGRTSSW